MTVQTAGVALRDVCSTTTRDGCAAMADYVTTSMTMILARLHRVCLWRRLADATLERFRRERAVRFRRLWIASNIKFLKQSHGFVGK